jgi:hypothetical protein
MKSQEILTKLKTQMKAQAQAQQTALRLSHECSQLRQLYEEVQREEFETARQEKIDQTLTQLTPAEQRELAGLIRRRNNRQ